MKEKTSANDDAVEVSQTAAKDPHVEVVKAHAPLIRPPADVGDATSGMELRLDTETRKLLQAALSRPPMTESAYLQIEKRLLPVVENHIMPRVERRLFQLLVQAEVLPPEALDALDREQSRAGRATSDLGDRVLGRINPPAVPAAAPSQPEPWS